MFCFSKATEISTYHLGLRFERATQTRFQYVTPDHGEPSHVDSLGPPSTTWRRRIFCISRGLEAHCAGVACVDKLCRTVAPRPSVRSGRAGRQRARAARPQRARHRVDAGPPTRARARCACILRGAPRKATAALCRVVMPAAVHLLLGTRWGPTP